MLFENREQSYTLEVAQTNGCDLMLFENREQWSRPPTKSCSRCDLMLFENREQSCGTTSPRPRVVI